MANQEVPELPFPFSIPSCPLLLQHLGICRLFLFEDPHPAGLLGRQGPLSPRQHLPGLTLTGLQLSGSLGRWRIPEDLFFPGFHGPGPEGCVIHHRNFHRYPLQPNSCHHPTPGGVCSNH